MVQKHSPSTFQETYLWLKRVLGDELQLIQRKNICKILRYVFQVDRMGCQEEDHNQRCRPKKKLLFWTKKLFFLSEYCLWRVGGCEYRF